MRPYGPHFHDADLIGVTEEGVQDFTSRGAHQRSTPGCVFLLEPGDMHEGYAAAALGFADQNHLGRWFRRSFGTSPAAYQKNCTNLPDYRRFHMLRLPSPYWIACQMRFGNTT
jgi:hypothetical protein